MLFVTHTLALPAPAHPGRRGAQRPGPAPELVVPLGGDAEAEALRREVEGEGVGTRYCRVWAGRGVLGAWALQHEDGAPPTVIAHNPLPDLTHADFVQIL